MRGEGRKKERRQRGEKEEGHWMKLGSRATVHALTWVCQHVVIVESLFIIFEYLIGCSHQLEHLTSIGILSTHIHMHVD